MSESTDRAPRASRILALDGANQRLVVAPRPVLSHPRNNKVAVLLTLVGTAVCLGLLSSYVAVAYLAGIFAWGGSKVLRYSRTWRRFSHLNNEGIAAIARGDLVQARSIFEPWVDDDHAGVATYARHNLAWTLLRQGDLRASITLLLENEQQPTSLDEVALAPTTAVDLALCYGLLGELADAEACLAEAVRRKSMRHMLGFPAMLVYAHAILHCRSDRCAEAARLLDQRWAECEATLTGETLRPLRIIRAFAIAANGPRDAGMAEMMVAQTRPAYAGEFAFLAVSWPDMAAFQAAHKL